MTEDLHGEPIARLQGLASKALRAKAQTDEGHAMLAAFDALAEDDLRAVVDALSPEETYFLAGILGVDLC